MAYIGNSVNNQGFTPAVDYFSGNGSTVTFTLSRNIASVAQVICAIDNVIQNPSSAYTVSGNAITFTSAPLSGTNNIWVEYTSLITTYAAISQSPSVIGDITASGGYLSTGSFNNSFVDGTIVDYVTGNGRITVGSADGFTLYTGGTSGRTALASWTSAGVMTNTGDAVVNGLTVGKGGGSIASNTVVGNGAGQSNTTGAFNVAIGKSALYTNATGGSAVAIGASAGYLYLNASETFGSVFVGSTAGYSTSTGHDNAFVGGTAAFSNTTGSNNVALGSATLYSNTTASNNTAVGYQAGYNSNAGGNTFVGESSGYGVTLGNYNTAIGRRVMYGGTITGLYNTAVGGQDDGNISTMTSLTTGSKNTAVGNAALSSTTTGSNNTALGYQAGNNLTTGTNNIYIGTSSVQASAVGVNYEIAIGGGITGQGSGYFNFGVNGVGVVYNQFSTNASWTRVSDQRLKTNIQNDNLGLAFITSLQPKTYTWKPSNEVPKEFTNLYSEENKKDTETVMHGLIAQEVKQALDNAGVSTFGGWNESADGCQGVASDMFIFPLINAIKELNAKVTALEAKLEAK